MSFFVAALWSISARLSFDFLAQLLLSARHADKLDLVTQVLCQGVAFVGALYFVVTFHDADRRLSDALGFRRTSVMLCLLAAAIGVALHGPLTLISAAIEARYPPSELELENLRFLYTAPALHQKVALVGAAGLFGPVVEETFFRGAILRNLRRAHTAGLTLFGTALLFAAVHIDLRNFFPIFL